MSLAGAMRVQLVVRLALEAVLKDAPRARAGVPRGLRSAYDFSRRRMNHDEKQRNLVPSVRRGPKR